MVNGVRQRLSAVMMDRLYDVNWVSIPYSDLTLTFNYGIQCIWHIWQRETLIFLRFIRLSHYFTSFNKSVDWKHGSDIKSSVISVTVNGTETDWWLFRARYNMFSIEIVNKLPLSLESIIWLLFQAITF